MGSWLLRNVGFYRSFFPFYVLRNLFKSDLNCNLLSEVVSNNSSHLLNIIDIYGLTQLITDPIQVPWSIYA